MLAEDIKQRIIQMQFQTGNMPTELAVLANISPKKFKNAIKSYAFGFNLQVETAIALFDDTVFGSAKNGFLLTTTMLYFRNITESAKSIDLGSIMRFTIQEGLLTHKIQVITRHGGALEIEVTNIEKVQRFALIGFLNQTLEILGAGEFGAAAQPQPAVAPVPTNCTNCSAIIPLGKRFCEYCGSSYN